jgi:hypothetical protein
MNLVIRPPAASNKMPLRRKEILHQKGRKSVDIGQRIRFEGRKSTIQWSENPPTEGRKSAEIFFTISSFSDLAEIALGLELLGHVVVEHVHVVGDGPEAGTRLTLHRTVRKKSCKLSAGACIHCKKG